MKTSVHQLMMVLAVLWVAPSARAQAYHDNVVIVLDASGSMRGALTGTGLSKIDGAKAALKEVLQKLPSTTRIGLLVFSAGNLTNDWVYPLGPRNDAELLRAIDLPEPRQGTPLGAYIKKGADRLLEERTKQFGYGTYRLLVVTDGEAGDKNLVDRYTPEVMARGITMDVIGVGMNQRHTLATKVHSYRAANDPSMLRQALQEVFAEVSATAGDNAEEDIFAQIAGIPHEVAAAAIQALATTGNTPIGERARRPKSSTQGERTKAPAASVPTPKSTSAPSVPIGTPKSKRFPVGLVILIVAMAGFIIVKASRRKHR